MTNKNGNRPFRLEVKFPLLDEPDEITEVELYRLINYLRRMSNEDYTFDFETGAYLQDKNEMSLRSVADITNTIVLFWIALTLIIYGIFKEPFWQGVAFMILWLFVSLFTSTVIISTKKQNDNDLK